MTPTDQTERQNGTSPRNLAQDPVALIDDLMRALGPVEPAQLDLAVQVHLELEVPLVECLLVASTDAPHEVLETLELRRSEPDGRRRLVAASTRLLEILAVAADRLEASRVQALSEAALASIAGALGATTPAPEVDVVAEPVAEVPVTEAPLTEEPVVEEPFAEEPVVEEPFAEHVEPDPEPSVAESADLDFGAGVAAAPADRAVAESPQAAAPTENHDEGAPDDDVDFSALMTGDDLVTPERLGRIMLSFGHVDEPQLEAGLAMHEQSGLPLGECLLVQGSAPPESILESLDLQRKLRRRLANHEITPASLDQALSGDPSEETRHACLALAGMLDGITPQPEIPDEPILAPRKDNAAFRLTEQLFIGEVLLGLDKITNDELEKAMHLHHHEGTPVDEALLQIGAVSEEEMKAAIELHQRMKKALGTAKGQPGVQPMGPANG